MLTVARPQDEITAWWYSGNNSSSARIAADAYARAVEYFERELAETQSERAWIRGQTSLEDVKMTVEQARDAYQDRSEHHARAKRWIDAFVGNIARYGTVLDTLASADPLHAGLAWGAIKFVFAGVSQYSQHAAEFAKALARIGDVLPRIRVELALYSTPHMIEAVAQLYAHVLLFLQRAVTWYTSNRTRRILKTVLRPSRLPIQEIVADMELCAENVKMIANTAGRAEIRGQSFALEQQTMRQRQIQQHLLRMQAQLEKVSISTQQHEQSLQQLIQHTMNSHDLLKSIKLDVGNSTAILGGMQTAQIIQVLRPAKLPEDILRTCQSFSRRRASWQQNDRATTVMISRLKEWTRLPTSSIFTVKSGARALQRTLDMVVQMTTLLQSTSYPTFWCISNPSERKGTTAVSDVLRSLIFQALRQDPSIPSRDAQLCDISSYQRPHSLDEWASMATSVLSNIPRCFVLVAVENLYRRGGYSSEVLDQLQATLTEVFEGASRNGCIMKLLIVTSSSSTAATSQSRNYGQIVVTMSAPVPAARRLPVSRAHNTALGRARSIVRSR
ncbi:uncharacterized protein Z520_11640 [Fonsecaea multimorphosa CBS 102226]|uniref:DUF7708 domain-containing protein n=1 Tax=Fonsecaea multimorphosa CBS 102226 TaxID=1442371 RepID=A0A0D2I5R1_9EURO|nr:uncharacterized protein Z520_11640 [Fonsecaea multimorphosa CBS 102226]KIX92611.1 hypothetical protein Z520_11640 [Fonsecaea multimorphosa CBS 102226]OAL17915.1 hypothetical protein AYO22_11179 [Fonsecaea multimorphosa]